MNAFCGRYDNEFHSLLYPTQIIIAGTSTHAFFAVPAIKFILTELYGYFAKAF